VAVPCYNGAAFLPKALEHLLNQSRQADEILVIDDGSTDDSARIAREYPIKLVQHAENSGLATARNTAIRVATGDTLVYVDVDAYADHRLIEVLAREYIDDGVSGVGGQGVEVNIQTLADRWRRAHASQSHGSRNRDVPFLYGLCMSFRADALREIGGFDTRYRTNAEDMDIGFRLTQEGHRLRYTPDAKVYHQRADDEASLAHTMRAWYGNAYLARKVNKAHPWTMFAGTLRRTVTHPLADILITRDAALARLSWKLGWLKLDAIWQASLAYRGGAYAIVH